MYIPTRTGVEQAPMLYGSMAGVISDALPRLLGQPSPKPASSQLPDWARIYLKSVRRDSAKDPRIYEPLFETITFHPVPFASSAPLGKTFEKLAVLLPSDALTMFMKELKRIRDARLFQYKRYSERHEKRRKLWQNVLISFTNFQPKKDLEPILIEALLTPPSEPGSALRTGGRFWRLGKRFVQAKLPKELSTQVTKSEWYMQDALYVQLGLDLRSMASKAHEQDANFKRKVEMKRKARAKRP
jgi:hypothetical protein